MEELLKEYSEKAREKFQTFLRKIPDNDAKINLERI